MDSYLLKFTACLFILWLVYYALLERQKNHNFKRFYLIGTLVLSAIIPLLTIIEYIEPVVSNNDITTTVIPFEPILTEVPVDTQEPFNWSLLLWTLYGTGVVLFGLRFIANLFKLYRTIHKHEQLSIGSFIYVLLDHYRTPHSFFRYIFLSKDKYNRNDIPKEVLIHEETHARQWHSADILLIELVQIVFWFHPLIYVLKHHIKLNHEFLADHAVINQGIAAQNYQHILLQFSSSTSNQNLASAINYSSIKKRFTVMTTQTSKTRLWFSSLLLLPIIAILFYSFADKEYVEKDPSETAEVLQAKNNTIQEGATEAMMKEYNDWINKLNSNSSSLFIPVGTFERLAAIYDLMSEEQRNSVETHPLLQQITPNLYNVEPNIPTPVQFESWKNEKEFAIWIDGKQIPNSELNNYSINDIVHYMGSKVHKNAQSKKFPQQYQFSLYTKDGFNKSFKEAYITDYRALTKTYSDAISEYLDGSQTDNSELRILKAQGDEFYNQFTKKELKKYNILPLPPVPSQKKVSHPKSNSKGGPNAEDIQEIYNPSFLEYILEMEKQGATFFMDGKNISAEQAKSIATNNKGERTEMTTQKDEDGNYMVQLSRSKKKKIYARSIDLKILGDNSYFIDGIKATKKTFVAVFNQLHQDLTPDERNRVMNIHVTSAQEISDKETWFIYNSLLDYGFHRIVTPTQEVNRSKGNTPFAIKSRTPLQQKPTKKQIEAYNAWAKAINQQMAKAKANSDVNAYPIVKVKTVKKYKAIYNSMTDAQKKASEPWPSFPPPPPPPPPAPERPTVIEIAEYDVWAKKLNTAMAKAEESNDYADLIVKQNEVKKYKAIYDMMTEAQKKVAEQWPSFPPPPPPPPASKNTKSIEIREVPPPPPPPVPKKSLTYEMEDGEVIEVVEVLETKTMEENIIIFINGKALQDNTTQLTTEAIKKLKLTLSKGQVSRFKLKIPGVKTDIITGNSITKTSISNLNKVTTGDVITLFDIKDDQNAQLPPIIIEILD